MILISIMLILFTSSVWGEERQPFYTPDPESDPMQFVRELESKDTKNRRRAIQCLAFFMDRIDMNISEKLLVILKNEDDVYVQRTIITILRDAKEKPENTKIHFKTYLNSKDDSVAIAAAGGLVFDSKDAVKILNDRLNSEDSFIRTCAAAELAQVDSKRAVPILVEELIRTKSVAIVNILEKLGKNAYDALPMLKELATDPTIPNSHKQYIKSAIETIQKSYLN